MNSLFLGLMQDIISLHTQSSCKLVKEEEHAFFMAYHFKDNIIKYNLKYLRANKGQINEFDSMDDETFFELGIYHEIGHYLDYQRNKDRALEREANDDPDYNFKLVGEQNAWKYGKEILPDKYIESFDILNERNINVLKTNMNE